eukprot:1236325-Pleurochrysis_carterae.AAC.3
MSRRQSGVQRTFEHAGESHRLHVHFEKIDVDQVEDVRAVMQHRGEVDKRRMSWPVAKMKSALLPRDLFVLRRGRVERRIHPRHPLGARLPR